MGEGFVGGLLILLLIVLTRVVACINRLIEAASRGGRGVIGEVFGCLVWFLLAGVIVLAILPFLFPSREAARRSQCDNNLRQIGLAMQNYHDKYGCFPPAYTVDVKGRRLHSWRVLLLPFLEQEPLYRQLHLDEPWDNPLNSRIFSGVTPLCFRCPSDGENREDTNYVMIAGPRTISNGPNSGRRKDITDGDSKTILVVETCDMGIRWYEPRDLRVDEMSFRINDPEHYSIASRHPGGAKVAFADGQTEFLTDATDPCVVDALTTINGGEDVSRSLP